MVNALDAVDPSLNALRTPKELRALENAFICMQVEAKPVTAARASTFREKPRRLSLGSSHRAGQRGVPAPAGGSCRVIP